MKRNQLKTGAQVRFEMEQAGVPLKEWCRAQKVSYDIARGVISGRIKAKRGQAHLIAIALGMKEGAVISPQLYRPLPHAAQSLLKVVHT